MGLVHFISFMFKQVYSKFRLQNNYFFMRLTERIVQNTIKIIDLRKKTWEIQENNVPLQSDF